jgi:YegS/Rv2252/BmrU family lipid kinase
VGFLKGKKMASISKALLFYNEKSGQTQKKDQCETIQAYFADRKIDLEVIMLPISTKEIETIVSNAISQGFDLFVAGGGDGTVSLIGNALIGTGLPLGILPLGTGNLLAQELNIPLNLRKALELITADNSEIIQIDTFKLSNRSFILNLSIGLTSEVMEETKSEDKQRFGIFAYLVNFLHEILGLRLIHFNIDCDGNRESYEASEILITNSRTTGAKPLKWSEDVAINDGALNLFVIRAANIFDIISIILSVFTKKEKANPGIISMQFRNYCRITTENPIKTQADGDPVGETPVDIHVNPRSLNILVKNTNIYQNPQSKKE